MMQELKERPPEEIDEEDYAKEISRIIEILSRRIEEPDMNEILQKIRSEKEDCKINSEISLEDHVEEYTSKLQSAHYEKNSMREEIKGLKSSLLMKDHEISDLQSKIHELSSSLLLSGQKEIITLETKPSVDIGSIQEDFNARISEFEHFTNNLKDNIDKLTCELNLVNKEKTELITHTENLKKEVLQQRAENLKLKQTNSEQVSDNEILRTEADTYKKEVERLKHLLNEKLDFESELKLSIDSEIKHRNLLMEQNDNLKEQMSEFKINYDQIYSEYLLLQSKIDQLEGTIKNNQFESNSKEESLKDYYEATIESLKIDQESHRKIISNMKDEYSRKQKKYIASIEELNRSIVERDIALEERSQEKMNIQFEMNKDKKEIYMNSIENIQKLEGDLESLVMENLELKEKIKALLELVSLSKQRISSTSNEITSLKDRVSALETEESRLNQVLTKYKAMHPNYISCKDDPVDSALADYINNLDEPLDLQFVREDPGIYSYGNKRVFMKIEDGKIIIRVGGGYMTVDEFVQMFTIPEIEKMGSRPTRETHRMSIYSRMRDGNTPSPRSSNPPMFRTTKVIKVDPGRGYTPAYGVSKRNVSPNSPIVSNVNRKRNSSATVVNK